MSPPFESIVQIGTRLRTGELTAATLTETLLERIEQLNPVLNAYVTVTAELAREQAARADRELAAGHDRGALHGIPIAIKDLFATRGIRTTCGSKLYADWVPDHDAAAVSRLREAGAVMLGKTGLHELAYGNTSINPFFGAIANPWATDHDPGGSSGGSAAAVAAGLAFAALGSDTGCSVRQPAHCCGIVGHKPTFGLVSKAGALPLVWSMDHVGPLARSVEDAAIMLDALSGHDPADPYSLNTTTVAIDLRAATLSGVRVGIIRNYFFEGSGDVIDVVEVALQHLREAGVTFVELEVDELEAAFEAAGATFAEAAVFHADNYRERPGDFSDEVRAKLETGFEMKATHYAQAQHFRRGFTARMQQLFSTVDVLVAPTATVASAPIAQRPRSYGYHAWKNTGIFDLTGQPSISVPCGLTADGLPVGLMITGPLLADQRVLAFAHAAAGVLPWGKRTAPI